MASSFISFKQKKGKMAIETLVSIIALCLVLVVFIIIFTSSKELFSSQALSSYACWATNGIKNGGSAFTLFPSACSMQIIDEPVDLERFVDLLRKAWWMYGRGEWEMGVAKDEVFTVYTITIKEDILLENFFTYLLTHNKGKEVKDPTYSDYNWFEEGSEGGQSLCFDAKSETIMADKKLEKGETYYILFFDDQLPYEVHDQVLISQDQNFDTGYWKDAIKKIASVGIGGMILGSGTRAFSILFPPDKGCVSYTPIGLSEGEA